MGAIKDIVDVCIALKGSSKDPKVIEAVHCIQSLIFALQTEQAALLEKNSELVTENLNLKRKLFDLEVSQARQVSHVQESSRGKLAGQASSGEANAALSAENSELKRKIAELEASKEQSGKKTPGAAKSEDQLERQTADVLKLFFDSANEMSSLQIALAFKMSPSVAEHHLDELLKRRFIVQSSAADRSAGYARYGLFKIRPEGRAYIASNSPGNREGGAPRRPD
jgi:regulator of replication initiation timing